MQIFRQDRVVTICKHARVVRKADLVVRPAMGDKRVHQPAVPGVHIAVEEGPEMVAADGRALLDDGDIHLRPQVTERQGDKASRQPASRQNKVMVNARHGLPLPSGRCEVERLARSEEHTSELQSLMRISYAVFCLKKKKHNTKRSTHEKC